MKVTPPGRFVPPLPMCPAGVVKVLSEAVSLANSLPPQLMDTATTPGWLPA